MARKITDLDYVEEQLQEVEQRLGEAVKVLDGLKTVQSKFKSLVDYYNSVQANFDEAKERFANHEANIQTALQDVQLTKTEIETDYGALTKDHQTRWEKLNEDIVKLQEQLTTANRNLRTDLSRQVNDLQGEVEQRLAQYDERIEKALSEAKQIGEELRKQVETRLKEADEAQQKKLTALLLKQSEMEKRATLSLNLGIAGTVMALFAIVLHFILGR